jgi:hypothetical protein
MLNNPNGCWDWVGWYGSNADQVGGEFHSIGCFKTNRAIKVSKWLQS